MLLHTHEVQKLLATIGNYNTEDVAKSVLMWFAARDEPDSLNDATKDFIEATMPSYQ